LKITQTEIEDLIVIEPSIFGDERGYFFESFNEKSWREEIGAVPTFIQDNESMSHKGVLRGLHFQRPPFSQGKLIRVVQGSVLDVAVDLRSKSLTYGHHFSVELSGKNKKQLYVPEGFAHGFLTQEDHTVFSYKCTQFYNKESEDGLVWNDRGLNINWQIKEPNLSEKDKKYDDFSTFVSPF
jgi:dTDP-4-dehydrorhamnose 3,5-epimerase